MNPSPAASTPPSQAELAAALLTIGCVKFGAFTLKSGRISPIYLDLRRLASYPRTLQLVAGAYAPLVAPLRFDHLAAVPYAGMPIGTALSLTLGVSMIYPRREVKDHGTKVAVEGVFTAGQTAVLVDDVATSGASTLDGLDKLRAAGLRVTDVVVLINREQGAEPALAAAGCHLHAVTTLRALLAHWQAAGAVTAEQVAQILSPASQTAP
jgi:uridine monophosphate synthetase